MNTAFAGESSGMVYEGERRFDLVVRLAGDKRKNLEDVQQLLIATPKGTQIPLNTVSSVSIIEGPNQIQRENSQRRIIVGFNVRGRDIQSTVNELQGKVSSQIKLPPGYYITYGGAFENLEAAKERLYFAVPLALVLIFLLLYFAFNSVKQGLLIYSCIPLSAIGGIFALAIRDIPFSVSAGIGFIALFGVAVLNGIVLMAEFNRLKKEGYTNLKRIVIIGTENRLRPILMTAFVASLGFLPMALSQGEGAEVQRPLATVVIGGLLVATFLTLFVLPILYMLTSEKRAINKKIVALLVLLSIFSFSEIKAQTPITLQQAMDIALTNNRAVKNERLKSEYQQKLIKSGINIPVTEFFGEYGQINSLHNDTRLGISQNINFPTVYIRQKNLLKEEWKSSVLNINMQEAQLKKQVAQVFYSLIYFQHKKDLLQNTDTLFSEFLDKAILRFQVGESNILEKVTAENQRGQIAIQLLSLAQDIEIVQLQFQLILNTEIIFKPIESVHQNNIVAEIDSTSMLLHPEIQFLQQQQQIAKATTKVERSKLLPDITISYNIMGMRTVGADDKIYNGAPQFQSAQIGLGIPIFRGSQRAKINTSKLNESIVANDYERNLKNFENDYHSAFIAYHKFEEIVHYYENIALEHAETIRTTANKQFLNGDINYLEWVLLINQAITIHSNYIEAVKNRNNAGAELNYYNNL